MGDDTWTIWFGFSRADAETPQALKITIHSIVDRAELTAEELEKLTERETDAAKKILMGANVFSEAGPLTLEIVKLDK